MLTQEALKTIEEILKRGNTAEVRKRKNEVIIIEVSRKEKCNVIAAGQ